MSARDDQIADVIRVANDHERTDAERELAGLFASVMVRARDEYDGEADLVIATLRAAGWRPPARTVSTVEELRALPEGAVVRSASGTITSLEHGEALLFGMDRRADPAWLKLPLTVIHEGGS
jgi:hypothetical protein